MKRFGMSIAMSLLALSLTGPVGYSAEVAGDDMVLGNDPVYIVQTLMNNNYMSLRHLYVPIINYGGGEKEFYKLVDSYSHALTLYLHRRLPEAAEMFRKNEQQIITAAEKVANRYRGDTEKLHADTVSMYIRAKMILSLESRNAETEVSLYTTGDTFINNASDSIRMANRYLDSKRPIDAIYYYRKSKAYCFEAFDNYRIPVPDRFKVDLADNRNNVYEGPEKGKMCVDC